MTLGIAPKRGKPRWLILLTVVALGFALLPAAIALAGPVSTVSGFEDDDGNLAVNGASPAFDWNGFATVSYSSGTAPFRSATKTAANGWKFLGLEDAQAVTSDTGFAGGTKQDDACASVIGSKAPNKDDLKRVYVSSKDVNGQTILNLAWVRIPQNTTSASAHIGFEFNKGSTPCSATSKLVQRMLGDMLIVYDFEGGTAAPVLTLRRWVTSGTCEISSNKPPCWGPAQNLTASGIADAKVNVGAAVQDAIGPSSPNNEQLNDSEFGEAGINLTAAGIFPAGTCNSFGKVFGVSRSSGNSGTAQMKDLAGPGDFNLTNCGTVTVIKHTDPAGLSQAFPFTSTLAGAQLSCTVTSATSFSLNDATTDTQTCTNVPAGSYTVTEGANPAGFQFDSASCEATGTGTSATVDGKVSSITMAGGGSVTCTYINDQQLGAIKVTKTRKHAASGPGSHPHAGVSFTVNGVTKQTDSNGVACFDGLAFASYNVTETLPTGYSADGDLTKSVTVDNNAACTADPYAGETVSFGNTPRTNLRIAIDSQVNGGTASTVSCVDEEDNVVLTDSTNSVGDSDKTASDLLPMTLTCTIVIDP